MTFYMKKVQSCCKNSIKICPLNYSEMQSKPISEVQFSEFPGGACPQTPSNRMKKLLSPLRSDQPFFKFDKTLSNFELNLRLVFPLSMHDLNLIGNEIMRQIVCCAVFDRNFKISRLNIHNKFRPSDNASTQPR